jgi:Tfp pilus assembly protein PilF
VKYPDNIPLLYLLASAYFEAGNDNVAIDYCDKTLMKDEKCEEAIELKAYIFKK